jgi:hypothetical protein
MRKKYAVMSTIAAGSLAVTGIGVGTSVAASSAGTPHILKFKAKQLTSHNLNQNTSVATEKDVAHGKVIGNDVVRFAFTHNTAKGSVAAAFTGGFIYAKFNVDQNGTISAGKVTGGTGKFAGVTGTITGHQVKKNVEKVTITYQ